MGFADLVHFDGAGAAFRLDVSFDRFATIAHRFSSAAGIDVDHDYDPRIIGLGTLHRALGLDNALQASSVPVALANEDGGLDWMLEPDFALTVLRTRARLHIGLYDPDRLHLGIQWRQLGEFVFTEQPRRQADRVTAVLSDDPLGFLADVSLLPTLADWDAQETDPDSPIKSAPDKDLLAMDVPVQLAFGPDWMPWQAELAFRRRKSGFFGASMIVPVCVTADTAVVDATDITEVAILLKDDPFGLPLDLRRTVPFGTITVPVWQPRKSSPITKDGRTFCILYLQIDGLQFLRSQKGTGYTSATPDALLQEELSRITMVWVKGGPLSSTTVSLNGPTPLQVVQDLVENYSPGGPGTVDPTSFGRVEKALGESTAASGLIRIHASGDGGRALTEQLRAIAASFDFDLFMRWDGKVGATGRLADYDALAQSGIIDAFPSFGDEELDEVADAIPSREQRGAPFNRVTIDGLKTRLPFRTANQPLSWSLDPSDAQRTYSADELIAAWGGRVFPRRVAVDWQPADKQRLNPWQHRALYPLPRNRLTFTTGLAALLLELGDYITVTWTRNLGGPFDRTLFQVEGLSFDPEQLTVTVEALRADDAELRKYLLDDEALLTRATGGSGRTATVANGSSVVTFSSGSLITDGVQPGDHLVLRDSTEAASSFLRNRALRIESVSSATQLVVSGDLTFGGTVPVAQWEIRRSHVTYPTAASDSTNYPAGANMYGRVASSADGGGIHPTTGRYEDGGTYSSAGTGGFTDGHRLLD